MLFLEYGKSHLKLISLAEFNNIMTLHVSYSDYIDMKLTSYTEKFTELNYKESQLNENESQFYVLFLQISEITTELSVTTISRLNSSLFKFIFKNQRTTSSLPEFISPVL